MSFSFRFKTRTPAAGRASKRIPATMNKTEQRYEREVLMPAYLDGRIIWYGFEAMTFRLGADLRYTPDFVVQLAGGLIECHEVKAGKSDGKPLVEDDSRVKIIAAAERFPFAFTMRWYDNALERWAERVF